MSYYCSTMKYILLTIALAIAITTFSQGAVNKFLNRTGTSISVIDAASTYDDGAVILGRNANFDFNIFKIDANEDTAWVYFIDGVTQNMQLTSIIELDDHNVVVSGSFAPATTGPVSQIVTLGFDENGTSLWTKTYASDFATNASQGVVGATSTGMLVSGGSLRGFGYRVGSVFNLDFNGDTLWARHVDIDPIIGGVNPRFQAIECLEDASGGLYVICELMTGTKTYALWKLDAFGNTIFFHTWPAGVGGGGGGGGGGAIAMTVMDAIINSNDQLVLTGQFVDFASTGTGTMALVIDTAGNFVSANNIQGVNSSDGNSIVELKEGGYAISISNSPAGELTSQNGTFYTDAAFQMQGGFLFGGFPGTKVGKLVLNADGDVTHYGATAAFDVVEEIQIFRVDSTRTAAGCYEEIGSLFSLPVNVTISPVAITTESQIYVGAESINIATETFNYVDHVFSITESLISPDCVGDQGGVDITMNGTAPYDVLWSNGTVAEGLTDFPGTFNVRVIDAEGCIMRDTFTIVDPPLLTATFTTSGVTCFGFGNGSIDLTAAGGTPGYTYEWTTLDTSEDLTGLSGGFYQVTIRDTNQCEKIVGIAVNEPQQLNSVILGSELTTCFGDCDGQLNALVTGGTTPYSILWNDPISQANDTAVGLCAGQYLLTATDNNGCISYANGDVFGPSLLSGAISATTTECGTSSGSAWVNVNGGTTPYAYSWAGGATSDTISGLDQQWYTVIVTDTNGCMYSDSVAVEAIVNTQEICVVTVDSNNLNQVNWTKPVVGNVEGYIIYRNIAGTYVQIGYNDYDSLSFFTDNSFGVDPNITSYRYKVSVVDTCGNESDLGGYHETIHLTANVGTSGEVNLIWDNYEGFAFGFYRILRDSTGTNNWEAIDSVPFSNFTYSDNNVPSIGADYLIEVVTPSLCDATKAVGDFNSSRSNRKANVAGPNWINETEVIRDVYPNPFSDQIKVEIQGDIIESVRLIDIQGRIVIVESAINNSSYVVNANAAVTGTYILQVKTKYGQFNEVVTKSW
jgi:hypothetical protein